MNTFWEKEIVMVDLKSQYQSIKTEIDSAIHKVLDSSGFINGPEVATFNEALAQYHGCSYAIGCANGTDALQIALMALDLQPGDEVLVPTFTYVATVEVIALLGLVPVMVDVYEDSFNLNIEQLESKITSKTRVIVPVHLFGQCCNMEPLLALSKKHNLFVIEDNAQAIGADYTFSDGSIKKSGTLGHIGCTSFFPSKNLGCYGDGGAITTNDKNLAEKMAMIANHGQEKRYYHKIVGINSRLDTIQAAILNVKLKYLDNYIGARQLAASNYNQALSQVKQVQTPFNSAFTSHVYHQYTMKIADNKRDELKDFLQSKGIPSMIYYPVPLYRQEAYASFVPKETQPVTELLCQSVLSLPIHTEMNSALQGYITNAIAEFFK